MYRTARSLRRALAGLAITAMLLAAPLTVSAHVNRLVGPYTFFIVLIEEPFFATNRAGFEFWVHDGARPVERLDRTLKAQAIDSTRHVNMVVSPINERGFYDVEFDVSGKPFDPGPGGPWTLRLTGSVEGLAVDESFVTTFPAYPRIAAAAAPVPANVVRPTVVDSQTSLAAGLGLVVGLGLVGMAIRDRRRRAPWRNRIRASAVTE